MKAYTDEFKQPLTKIDVEAAIAVIWTAGSASPSLLQRRLKIGYGKAATLVSLLEDAHTVSRIDGMKPRTIILTNMDAATNAALRQLKKGHR